MVHETMWRSFDELFSNMKRRDMLERLVNEYLYGVDANVARNTLAHEWFWEPKVSGKWFLNGESNDRFLLRLLILSQAPFVEAAIIGIGEAVRFSEKAVPEEGQ